MTLYLGPILGFHGVQEGNCKISVLVVTDSKKEPKIYFKDCPENSKAILLKTYQNKAVWRFDLSFPMLMTRQVISYNIDNGKTYNFFIPSQKETPSLVYASCNGFSEAPNILQRNESQHMWQRMVDTKNKRLKEEKSSYPPYHLLLLGGDQLYCDAIKQIPIFKNWFDLSFEKQKLAKFTKNMQIQAEKFYFENYLKQWSSPAIREVLATIPSVMMWDDHDIIDGWGSYKDEFNDLNVMQGIFNIAKEWFELFQLRSVPYASNFVLKDYQKNYTHIYKVNDLAILSLDLRGSRSYDNIIPKDIWNDIYKVLEEFLKKKDNITVKHLLVMSSLPVIYPSVRDISNVFEVMPMGNELDDDFRDHWSSCSSHQIERIRLLNRLKDLKEQYNLSIVLLSGDVHVGAMGVFSAKNSLGQEKEIYQLISSSIMHPTVFDGGGVIGYIQKNLMRVIYNKLFKFHEKFDDKNLSSNMLPFASKNGDYYISHRNWLSLDFEKDRIWANWCVEGINEGKADVYDYTKVISL